MRRMRGGIFRFPALRRRAGPVHPAGEHQACHEAEKTANKRKSAVRNSPDQKTREAANDSVTPDPLIGRFISFTVRTEISQERDFGLAR